MVVAAGYAVPRMFCLQRLEDATGVSGVGIVAWGIEFTDGRVALRWCVGQHQSTACYDSITAVKAIHGHDGKTIVEWVP